MAAIGDVIGGRYKILEIIGHGGMAIVYLAMDIELKSNWVLKEIKKSKNESKYEKALREARLMSEFKCRGIPIIINILEYKEEQLAYIVMEYLPGKSLQDMMIERGGALPVEFVIHAGVQICEILSYLHTSNPPIIHRDIKPANIIYVESDKSFWLLDFGEAKRLTPNNIRDDMATGTQEFMAPEQFSERMGGRQSSNQKSDLFSLGASIFYMLTGQISTKSNITNQYYSINDVDNTVSPTLSKIVSKAMEIMPTARYADANEMRSKLIECTEESRKKRHDAVLNIRRTALILASSIVMLIVGAGFRIANNVKEDQTYAALIKNAQSESGDTLKKIDDAIDAIALKPQLLEPYTALKNLYESDNIFTKEEDAKFQALITPNRDELEKSPDYSKFAYDVGIMYLIYYTESSESYIKAIDWFSSVNDDHKQAAEIYLRIGQFDRDITKKLSTGDESGEFRKQWDSLREALSLASTQNNDLLQMAICKKTISAMDEYCVKFKKDGVEEYEMRQTLREIREILSDFIPNSEEYHDSTGNVDFSKYYDSLIREKEQSENGTDKINGTDSIFLEIYPFLSAVTVEIEKTYG